MKKINYILYGLTLIAMPVTKFPHAEITNGLIHASIYLPDEKNSYYQGVRFDWSGNMSSLEYKGHNYFGQWFSKYSPEIHDVIMGPVEDFTPLDFSETTKGGNFVKIGVGVLYKPDDKPYLFNRYYELLNPGKWSVKKSRDKVLFIHDLEDKIYSYHYEKNVRLIKDKPELVIEHKLKNKGSQTIETSVYDHNFFMIDKHPIGPGLVVKFPFDLKVDLSGEGVLGMGTIGEIEGNQISFIRTIGSGEEVECPVLEGFGKSINDYEIRIENKITGAGVRITCDQPLLKLAFWSCSTTLCPEPYIKIKVEPGKEITWSYRYEFYMLNK
jgi:hypothetical protein